MDEHAAWSLTNLQAAWESDCVIRMLALSLLRRSPVHRGLQQSGRAVAPEGA